MKELKKDAVRIPLKDIYQLLIAECRYGYTRNNHLMPSGAYDRVKEYLPGLCKIDKGFAVSIARQICEEAISDELLIHFRDGVDDQHGNMWETIQFVEWLRAWLIANSQTPNDAPYNYPQYVEWFHEAYDRQKGLNNDRN